MQAPAIMPPMMQPLPPLQQPQPQQTPFQPTLYPTPSLMPHPMGGRPPHARFHPTRVSPYGPASTPQLTPYSVLPTIHPTATVRKSFVLGDVRIGPYAHVVNAKIRADEGTPFYIGAYSNVQDNVVIHGHSTQNNGQPNYDNLVAVPGKGYFSVYVGDRVSLAHGVTLHGPVEVQDDTFVSFNSTIDHAKLGKNVEIGAHSYISNVTIPDNTAIAAGAIITKPEDIERFKTTPSGIGGKIASINSQMVLAYHNLMPPR